MFRVFTISLVVLGVSGVRNSARASLQSISFVGNVTYNAFPPDIVLAGDAPIGTPVSGVIVYDNTSPPLGPPLPNYLEQLQSPPAILSVTFGSTIPHVITNNNDWRSMFFNNPDGDLAVFSDSRALIDGLETEVDLITQFDGPSSVFTTLIGSGPLSSQITSAPWDYQFGYLNYASTELHFSVTFVPEPSTVFLVLVLLQNTRRRRFWRGQKGTF